MALAQPLAGASMTPPAHPCRYGIVRVSQPAFDMAAAEGVNLFDHFLPLSVKVDPTRQEIMYSGFHPSFDEIEVNSIIPEYRGVIVDGRKVPHWQRLR